MVEKGQALYGVVPFENSTYGTVVQTVDRFISTNLKIRAETYLEVASVLFPPFTSLALFHFNPCLSPLTPQIRHHLLSNSQKSLIRRIYSHPEAIGQCKRWIDNNYPGVEVVNVSSTANAAKSVLPPLFQTSCKLSEPSHTHTHTHTELPARSQIVPPSALRSALSSMT